MTYSEHELEFTFAKNYSISSTNKISKFSVSSNLQVDHFFGGSILKFAEFWVFRMYIGYPNCDYGRTFA